MCKYRQESEEGRCRFIDVKKGRMRIRMKVGLALCVVVLCIGIGIGVMHFAESLGWLDSFYLSVLSETLPAGLAFTSVWLLVSTLVVARAFLCLAKARVVKWVRGHYMTVSEFLTADTDYNGFITKSEYVLYKLKDLALELKTP